MQQSGYNKRPENRMHSMERELQELRNLFMQGRRQQNTSGNSETGSASGSVQDPKLQEPKVATSQCKQGKGISDGNPVENTKCKLLHWSGSGEVVAEGRVSCDLGAYLLEGLGRACVSA